MTTLMDHPNLADTELISSRVGRIDPDNFENQSGASIDDDKANDTDEEQDDETVDEDGDLTDTSDHGEHDHHQDDNYALGGHVTRSSS